MILFGREKLRINTLDADFAVIFRQDNRIDGIRK